MKKKQEGLPAFATCILFTFLLFNLSYGQKSASVNLLTGSVQVSVPVGTLDAGDISFPIAFYYGGNGVRVEDYGQRYGIGWSFSAEAAVTRELRGFPDDAEIIGTGGNPSFKGWIKTGNAANAVDNFSIANNPASCSGEVTDYNYMNNNIQDHLDSEPDMFNVNVPGLSFQFVFDKNQQIKIIPYRDVKVEYTTDPLYGLINSFTITNDRGIRYLFNNQFLTYQYVDTVLSPSSLPAFRRNYRFYKNNDNGVAFASRWMLTSITDTKANALTFVYETAEGNIPSFGGETVKLVKYNPSTSSYDIQKLYGLKMDNTIPRLKQINVTEGSLGYIGLDFVFHAHTAVASLYTMRFGKSGLLVSLGMKGPFNKTNDNTLPGRYFLADISLTSTICASYTQKYKFTYNNVDFTNNTSYCTGVDSITNAQDYWGYYNGQVGNANLIPPIWVYPDNPAVSKFKINPIPSYTGNVVALTGANRTVNSNAVAGSLKRIVYPNGGVTEIEYDNNEYFDSDVNAAVAGGGIRVRKITDNDGLNTNEVTYYDYNDPSTNITTGKATSVPDFAFAFPNSATFTNITDKVLNCTYRTLYDYSDVGKMVIYGKVTERKTNGGKIIYEFNTSATRGSAATGDWAESFVYVGRQMTSVPTPCNAITPDFLTSGKNIYPFPANANFDFERGLLNKVSNYNESGGLVNEETYTYDLSHSATTKIAALKYDDVFNVRGYSKYYILANQDRLLVNKTTKNYNATNPTSTVYTMESEIIEYPTGSVAYRLPIVVKKQNSDGRTQVTRFKYAKDYTTTGTGDFAEQAIHQLKEIGFNAVIESYQSVQQSGVSEKYLSGSISKFKKMTIGEITTSVPLSVESYSFAVPNGTTSFTPSTISSGTFTMDSKYFKVSSVLSFNDNGTPGTVIDNSRRYSSALYYFPQNLKVADISNARQQEVLMTTFDYNPAGRAMTYSSGSVYQPGRYSSSCFTLNTGTSVYGDMENAKTNKNLIFSAWLLQIPGGSSEEGETPTTGTLTVSVTGTGYSASYNLSFSVMGTKWKYYDMKIPKPTVANFTVTVTTSAAIRIDDILVYPDNATIKTNSYTYSSVIKRGQEENLGIQLTAETAMNGTTRYYTYANNTIPYLVKDVDENIVEINEKRELNQSGQFSISTMNTSVPAQVNIPVNIDVFSVVPCSAGVTYTWNFGDGSATANTSVPFTQHTYTAPGSYVVTCTMSAPGFTTFVYTDPLRPVVVYGAPVPTLCVAGVVEYSSATGCEILYCQEQHTLTCNNTKFRVGSVLGASVSDITNWVWEKAPVGSGTWTTVSSGANPVLNVPFSTTSPVTASYRIRCTITLSNGLTATSPEFTVLSY